MRNSLVSLVVLSTLATASISFAQDAAPAATTPAATPDWTFPMTVGYATDYIFRGQSQTWGKGSLQASFQADHSSGFYAGVAMASVSDKWLAGASLETDLYAGFRNTIGDTGLNYDVGGIYYLYPDANWDKAGAPGTFNSTSLNTFEIYAALSYKWLSFKTGRTLTDYFGWNTNNSGVGVFNTNGPDLGASGVHPNGSTKGSYFYEANGAFEFVPTWTVSGQLGRQIVAESSGLDVTYYKVGVSKAFDGGWAVGAFYSGTNEPNAYKNFGSLSNSGGTSNVAKQKFFVTAFKSF